MKVVIKLMMKRNGFVSNSSSSNFIVGFKGVPTSETILKSFQVPKESMMYELAKDIAKAILYLMHPYEEYIKTYCDGEEDECYIPRKSKELASEGYTVYVGEAYNEEGGLQEVICDRLFGSYKDDNFVLDCSGR